MPVDDPPEPAALAGLPRERVDDALCRVHRADRGPWWFASVDPHRPHACGRFDVPAVYGACYTATSVTGAVAEALQAYGRGGLPIEELRTRRVARIRVSSRAPAAAALTEPGARGFGITQALWADADRARSQAWALALLRAGWRALRHGLHHDPTGGERGVTLLDTAGAHLPYDDPEWEADSSPMVDDPEVREALHRLGIHLVDGDEPLERASVDDVARRRV